MLKRFNEWFFVSNKKCFVETGRRTISQQVGPGLGPHRTAIKESSEPICRRETVPYDGWPVARRLRFGLNAGLLASAMTALFWATWWLIVGSVPETTAIPLLELVEIILPFAVSRLWDIPAVFVWVIGLVLAGFSIVQNIDASDETLVPISGLITGLLFGLICEGMYFGLVTGLIFMLVLGLASGLTMGIISGRVVGSIVYGGGLGLIIGLSYGLGYGISGGLTNGLALGLPVAVVALPLLVALMKFLFKWGEKNS